MKLQTGMEEENIRLKKKINELIDLIEKKQQEKETDCRDGCRKILGRLLGIFKEIDKNKLASPAEKAGKNKDYIKVRKDDLDRLLGGEMKEEAYDFLAATGTIKTQVNGKVFWCDSAGGESVKVVLIRKSAYRYFLSVG